jgi:hypothetical protein
MATTEERVSLLEAKMDDHSRQLGELRQAVVHLEQRMDRRFEGVEARFLALEDKMERRFDGVDRGLSRLVAIQLASMTAMVAALAGIVTAILQR